MPTSRQSARKLSREHAALCFVRAFPNSIGVHRDAGKRLAGFDKTVAVLPRSEKSKLSDSGIAATRLDYGFSFEVARWLARRCRGEVSIDWQAIDDTSRLDELLSQLLQPSEDEHFDSGYVSTREWIDAARAGSAGTDFDWLLAQLGDKSRHAFWSQLYDAAEIPLNWNLSKSRYSKTRNALPVKTVCTRELGMRRRPRFPKQEIARPLKSLKKMPPHDGSKLIDIAMASLAVRHRETYHFNHANLNEVYIADVGEGISVAVLGLLPNKRYALECTMGYLILSNGVPIGYGGASAVFRQVNTGINIFDEYRGSEASFLWIQVMRVYHALVGCTRFIANPYQFGSENAEGLRSGAFWFYYRIGYRPVLAEIRRLALRETKRLRRNKNYRSDLKTLRRLASCDMHLTLPAARNSDLFEEDWLQTSSMLATEILAAAGGKTRSEAANIVATKVARDIGLKPLERWPVTQRQAFRGIAPIVAAAEPANWPASAKRRMRNLLRAKGDDREAHYAKMMGQHDKFLNSLQNACRIAVDRA